MSMSDLLKAFELLDENLQKGNGHVSGNKTEKLVSLAEKALDVAFPPTYRRFLEKYGCGDIAGFEVYGVIDDKFAPGIPDGIWLTLDERKTGSCPNQAIIIADAGFGFYYVLDSGRRNADGEYPVYLWEPGENKITDERVNNDFGEFLLEQIEESLAEDNED